MCSERFTNHWDSEVYNDKLDYVAKPERGSCSCFNEGRNPQYFPTIGEYTSLLEQTGFRVTLAQHFDKPTPLKGNTGARNWLDKFADYFFLDVTSADKESIQRAIEAKVKPNLDQSA